MSLLKSKFVWALIALFVAFTGATIAWFVGADRLEARVVALSQANSSDPVTLDCADQAISGYPFRYVVTCEQPRIAVKLEGVAPFEIAMTRLQRVALVYRQNQFLFFAKGPLVVTDLNDNAREVINAKFNLLSISSRTSDKGLERISVAADNLELLLNANSIDAPAQLKRLEAHLVPSNPAEENVHQDYDLFVSGTRTDAEKPFTLRLRAQDFAASAHHWSDKTFASKKLAQGVTLDARLFGDVGQQIDFDAPDYQGTIELSAKQGVLGLLASKDSTQPELARFFRDLLILGDGKELDISGLFELSQP